MSVFDDLILQGTVQTVQHRNKISDQASACAQTENKEWKYQKKSVAGGLVGKHSVQSSSQER